VKSTPVPIDTIWIATDGDCLGTSDTDSVLDPVLKWRNNPDQRIICFMFVVVVVVVVLVIPYSHVPGKS